MEEYDVVVIGGGPGGYVAAIRAAQVGKKTALIEKQHIGGICLNWGCIPTKALLKSAELLHQIKHAEDLGIKVEKHNMDIRKIVERSRAISSKLTTGIKGLLKKNKVTLIEGEAKIEAGKLVSINSSEKRTTIKALNIIIATGARPRVLDGFEPDGKNIWTSKEAMIPDSLPKSMIIVGSGAIGVEFASFYNTLGTEVTLIEAQGRILPVEDEEISKLARKSFEGQGIKIHTSARLLGVHRGKDNITLEAELEGKKQQLKAEKLLMAVGIVGNVENLGLEKTRVKVEKGHIITDSLMQTGEPGVFAIGDVAGAPWLAHKASHEGIIAAEVIAGGKPHSLNTKNIPGCTYSYPQVASVGLTEEEAKGAGYELRIGRFPFMANGKALVLGEPEGLVKTIFDSKTGELLGAHMIGAEVTELIQGYVIAKNAELTEAELISTIFPHPTLSEMMHESVLGAYARAIHI